MIFLAGLTIIGVILLWMFGAGMARFIGIVLILDGVGGMAIRNSVTENPRFPIEAVVGLGLWLLGHWLFAAKDGLWRSRLGQRVWRLPGLSWMSPVRHG
ncbi:hypothetical protein [Gordonia phthalatica]|nr:hypothetical protein [Gordonia phthalatica]